MPVSGDIFDGYQLIRRLGRGGFGEVWLCRLEATGELRALKILPACDSVQLERERQALIRYRAVASDLHCPNLLNIEHVNRTDAGLFYTMPLADGATEPDPADPTWLPKTLATLIIQRKVDPQWFNPEEIQRTIIPLIQAVQRLSDAGVVHRDIKPENILFISGRPCLGDISLLTDDGASITRRGTPGYAAPSWYLESGGNPDMWGLATTLYSLATGNAPDKLGRAAFLWPPQGEQSVDREAWDRFHRVILRATHEQPSERFLRFDDFASALEPGTSAVSGALKPPGEKHAHFFTYAVCVLLIIAGGGFFWAKTHPGTAVSSSSNSAASATISPEFEATLTSATVDYEKLFSALHKRMLKDPEKLPSTERFEPLIKKIKEASSAEQITQILKEIDRLVPSLRDERFVPSDKELNEAVKQLDSIACRPLALAKNSEEGFRGDRFCNPLRNRAYEFQAQADQVRNSRITKRQNMASSLEGMVAERANHLKTEGLDLDNYARWATTYKACKEIQNKLTAE